MWMTRWSPLMPMCWPSENVWTYQGAIFGLVAPLYDQAKVAAQTLMGEQATFVQKELSTKLKVTGCDLFSAGDFADGEGREDIVFRDPARGVYRRLVIEGQRGHRRRDVRRHRRQQLVLWPDPRQDRYFAICAIH